MKHRIYTLARLVLTVALACCLAACGGGDEPPEWLTISAVPCGPGLWGTSYSDIQAIVDAYFPGVTTVEFRNIQADGSVPLFVDGAYVGDALVYLQALAP